ncbi:MULTISPECIES: LacI family DNA-binding transcriptional regulator [Paenarthrobacter]|jgi:LacI family transcriptional regulator|uniref:LacI family DNA-binding transcriptional regulator n=1 Tax=Paenarthrobacter TaxID=1742992 RepID=UPI0003602258|nr:MULTISPECIES: LacI family DNA-binding transcriptional regulator [Paenarthrobacter]KQQ98558.1 LacI family transcriptional regulator [Arthrobacter sp. Leaf145]SKB68469.1 transcriptional regulator, LacI family [Arthrobacter sp. 31Cvi3.1E]BCW09362.1 alanine racemase [Arthrobacter sp. NtRootA2]BCW13442.1 alanine racemase [Arthrobacter sp. NtRootA4]BCW21778.1 alanine racemase [Arthrobacter sp. NtRootC7]BCW26045.1 alanine racemase [Arthrobacter sp. NtRootC45]BCW30315.1 alanine racemase [Arthroba
MSSKNIGIKDVAVAAGVSVTTVSHVLNEVSYARISSETRDKVRNAAEELGYGPNRLAQALRTQRTGMLGLVSEEIATTPHAGRIILGADEAAKARGYNLMIINTPGSASLESRQADVQALLERRVDGILYATMYHRNVELPRNLENVPSVLVDSVAIGGNITAVVPDEDGGARAAVGALLDAGHTRIGFINNTDDVPATRQRLQAFRAMLTEAGLDGDAAPVESEVSEVHGGYAAAKRILSREDRADVPTALFCYNDRMAMGAYRAAAELGLSIPKDLSVVGFDDQELIAANLYPGLTTVALPHYEMGAWATDHLIDAIEGKEDLSLMALHPTVLGCPLVRRDSVAAPR